MNNVPISFNSNLTFPRRSRILIAYNPRLKTFSDYIRETLQYDFTLVGISISRTSYDSSDREERLSKLEKLTFEEVPQEDIVKIILERDKDNLFGVIEPNWYLKNRTKIDSEYLDMSLMINYERPFVLISWTDTFSTRGNI